MLDLPDNFELEYQDSVIRVRRFEVYNQSVYQVKLPGDKRILNLTRALNAQSVWFWTSIPEGRQKEAMEIGRLIEQFVRSIQ